MDQNHDDESVVWFESQINELNKRMSAIESLLNRLEEKMTPADLVRNVFTCAAASSCGFLSSQ